ncbi:MAG: type IX secretion system membrane protein PorP/SprF [Crocinitomix sp.]|nr:type IX secretion system membrane protein PorP/SprF [Crocinitomix sp.]
MIKFLLSTIFILTTYFTVALAQQDRQFTQFMFDRMSYNPATTGFNGYCGTLIYRNQWDRVQDAPNTTLLNVQGNLQNLNVGRGTVGVGLSLSNDVIGFLKSNNVVMNAAYHMPTDYGTLSTGVGVGLINVGFDPNWVTPSTPVELDPSLVGITQKIGQTGFDNNFGLYWYGDQDYYVGFSMTHVAPAKLTNLSFNMARHYYVMAGVKKEINKGHNVPIFLNPSTLIKADGATMVFDLNLKVDVWVSKDAYFWGGITYRLSDAFAFMAGYARDNFKVGYSFDAMTNPLSGYGRGSHELMVSYCIFPPKKSTTRTGWLFKLR